MLPWQPFSALYIWGAHWRHLKNTTEPSMCGGDAALCQIALITCCICDTPLNCYYFTCQSYPFAYLTSFRRITKFTTVYGSSVVQLPYCIRFSIYIEQTEYN